MPGIITHNKIFDVTIDHLSIKKKKNYLLRSLDSLFISPEFRSAALFGALGPNIFDYIPQKKRGAFTGSVSFALHNGGSGKLVLHMIDILKSYSDYNTNWVATQRAYIYGFISHLVTDQFFHPFVFFNSGFTHNGNSEMKRFYREQNLLFQYSLDNYFMFRDETSQGYGITGIENMFPEKCQKGLLKFNKPIKTLILQSLHEVYPELFQKVVFSKPKKPEIDYSKLFSHIDILPFLIKKVYKIKMTKNKRLKKFLLKLNSYKILHNDFFVCYPDNKRFNKDILNEYRSRWEFPTGKAGYHYDSIENLITKSAETTVEIWERIESVLYNKDKATEKKKNISKKRNPFPELLVNIYTGDGQKKFEDMEICDPIKIKY